MLRIVMTLIVVLAMDMGLLYLGVGDPDEGWGKVWRALDTHYEKPTLESQRALDAAEKEYNASMSMRINIIRASLAVVTGGGLFIVVREFKRRRTRATPKAPSVTAPTI